MCPYPSPLSCPRNPSSPGAGAPAWRVCDLGEWPDGARQAARTALTWLLAYLPSPEGQPPGPSPRADR
jgi:hypothetical protein